MPDIPNYNIQPTFPIASVIDAAQRNNALQYMAQQQGQQSLVQGLGAIGQIGESLYQRKLAMAQALAGAKMYAASPEGQQMLAPTQTQTPIPQAVTPNQTAAYDPTTGSVTPNASPTTSTTPQSPVASLPKMTQTLQTPSPISMGDLQTAFMGEKPSDLMTQLFERQKARQQFALDTRKQAFTEQTEPIKLAQQEEFNKGLLGLRGQGLTLDQQNNLRTQITNLATRQDAIRKEFPELTGTFIKGVLPEGSNAKEAAAFKAYQDIQNQMDDYTEQLRTGKMGGTRKSNVGITMTSPNGTTFTVNP